MNWLIALVATIVIEFVVYAVAIRKDLGKLVLYSVLINGFTNPLGNLLYSYSYKIIYSIIYIEIGIFIAEIFLIKYLFGIKYWKAVLISLIANLISFGVGIFLIGF